MLADLADRATADVIGHFVVLRFVPLDADDDRPAALVALLTPRQRAAVRTFVDHLHLDAAVPAEAAETALALLSTP